MSDILIDLFLSKKDQIYNFIKQRGRVKTHELIAFGLSIFTNRGDRYGRDLAEEGLIWRMREDLKKILYKDCKEDVWSVFPSDKIL